MCKGVQPTRKSRHLSIHAQDCGLQVKVKLPQSSEANEGAMYDQREKPSIVKLADWRFTLYWQQEPPCNDASTPYSSLIGEKSIKYSQ